MDNTEIPSKFELVKKIMQLQNTAFVLLQDANSYTNRGDLNSAKEVYDKLIVINQELLQTISFHNEHYDNPIETIPIIRPSINVMFMQANVVQSMGNLKQAEQLRKEALALASEHFSKSDLADMERSNAESLLTQGRFNEALSAYETSRDLFKGDNNMINWTIATIDIIEIYRWLGDYERALIELKHADEMIADKKVLGSLEESNQTPNTIFGSGLKELENISALIEISKRLKFFKGLVNEYSDKIEDAEISFQDLLSEYEKQTVKAQKVGENGIVESNLVAIQGIKSHLAAILIKKGNYQEGLSYAYDLESSFKNNGLLRPKLAAILKNQAEALLKLGKSEEALEKLEAGIKDFERYYDPDLLWKLQWSKGRAYYAIGQKMNALEAYSQAVKTINDLRKVPLGYRLDSTYMKDKLELFETAIDLAYTSHFFKQCCEFMEYIKSRILSATLSIPRRSQTESSGELERQFDELTRQLNIQEYAGYKDGWSNELKKKKKISSR